MSTYGAMQSWVACQKRRRRSNVNRCHRQWDCLQRVWRRLQMSDWTALPHCTDKNSHRLTFQCMKSMPHHTAVHLHGKACTNVIAWQVSTTVLLTAGHQQDLNKGDIKQRKIKQQFHENVHLLKMDSYRFSTIYKTLHIKCDQMEKSPLFLDYILTTAKNEITTEAHQGRVQDAHF